MSALEPTREIGITEAKRRLPELLDRVERGEEWTITRRGIPVARLVLVRRVATGEEKRAAIEAIRAAAKGESLGGLRVRDLTNEGRR